MSEITKNLGGFLFNGADLTLATAPFKNNIGVLYGFNADGTGYTSFKPSSNFNSLTTLKQDGSYIMSAVALGFELPGATVTAAGNDIPASNQRVNRITPYSVTNDPDFDPTTTIGRVGVNMSAYSAIQEDAFLVYNDQNGFIGLAHNGSSDTVDLGEIPSGTTVMLTLYNKYGQTCTASFVVPPVQYVDPSAA